MGTNGTTRGDDATVEQDRSLFDRLARGTARSAVEGYRDQRTMARTYGAMFWLAGSLTLLTLLLEGSPDRNETGLAIGATVAILSGTWFYFRGERARFWVFRVSPCFTAVLVAVGVYYGGAQAVGAYAMFFLWMLLATGFFLEPRWAVGNLVIGTLVYAIVLATLDGVAVPGTHLAMVAGTMVVVGLAMVAARGRLEDVLVRAETAARTDSLTGLANRREFEECFERELARAIRTTRPIALVIVDLDYFKEFNDRLGHAAGDGALVRLSQVLTRTTRAIDTVARLGGEEFAVLAPETDENAAHALAERMRIAVRLSRLAGGEEPLTVSCGVAAFPVHGATAGELLHAADRALYEAKEGGRDRTVVHLAEPEQVQLAGIEADRVSPRLLSLISLADAVDRRKGTPGHSQRVALYAEALARRLGLDGSSERVRIAALLRDVGEVGLPESILGKPGALSDDERAELHSHPEIGARIVGAARLGPVGEWIHSHHERFDGTGYPRGLHGDEAELEARVIAVVDAYSAMTADRPGRQARTSEAAVAELRACAGSQFDPEIVTAFVEVVESDLDGAAGARRLRRA